jgi:hypothetical protein
LDQFHGAACPFQPKAVHGKCRKTIFPRIRLSDVAMMSAFQREQFNRAAARLAAETLAQGGDVGPALSPMFQRALQDHPDEDDRLLELWDRLTSRQLL